VADVWITPAVLSLNAPFLEPGWDTDHQIVDSALRVPVLRGDFSVADCTRDPVARESLCAFGADDSGGRDCQHTLLSHFHGACGFAAGGGR
jgi:hypothetical protein